MIWIFAGILLIAFACGVLGLVGERRKLRETSRQATTRPHDLWDAVLVTHDAVLDRLPMAVRDDFRPRSTGPGLTAAEMAAGLNRMGEQLWKIGPWGNIVSTLAPTTAEIHAGICRGTHQWIEVPRLGDSEMTLLCTRCPTVRKVRR